MQQLPLRVYNLISAGNNKELGCLGRRKRGIHRPTCVLNPGHIVVCLLALHAQIQSPVNHLKPVKRLAMPQRLMLLRWIRGNEAEGLNQPSDMDDHSTGEDTTQNPDCPCQLCLGNREIPSPPQIWSLD